MRGCGGWLRGGDAWAAAQLGSSREGLQAGRDAQCAGLAGLGFGDRLTGVAKCWGSALLSKTIWTGSSGRHEEN